MDGAPAGYLIVLARVASLNPPVMFHEKFTATIAACWSCSGSSFRRQLAGQARQVVSFIAQAQDCLAGPGRKRSPLFGHGR